MMVKSFANLLSRFRLGTAKAAASSSSAQSCGNDALRLSQAYEAGRALKLHFGCGPRILKGWINIDLAFEPYQGYLKYYTDKHYPEEIRGDRSDLFLIDITTSCIPLPDNSVDLIFHEDFIEHLSQRNQVVFLAESRRVLKPGCVHRVNTPDLLVSMREHSDFQAGRSGVYLDEWDKNGHLNLLTPASLQEMASMAGYSKVVFATRNCSLSKEIPLEYRPDPNDRDESGNIFADLVK